MNKNEKKTYQVLFFVGVLAFLIATTYGIAQIWAFLSVSREKTEIFNEVKDLPDVYTPRVNWLPDEPLERPMEDYARKLIGRDYVRALYQRNIAILTKDTAQIQDYFTVLAKSKIKSKIDESKNHLVEQVEFSHNIKLSYYSADGQIVAFTDFESEHAERVWDRDRKNMLFDQDIASYQVIMILEDGYWRIHNMKRVETKVFLADTTQILNEKLKNSRLNKLKLAKGINYYPQASPFKNFWINYDSIQVEKDFKLIKSLNFNAVRIFINYEQFGKGNVIPEMLERLGHLMSVAENNDVGVVLTLFDFNSDFNLFNFTSTDRQLETILTKLKNNKALLAYDLKNEPDIDYNYQDSVLVNQWLNFIVKRAKLYDPDTPFTIGWATADKADFLSPELDFVSFHFYKNSKFLKSDIDILRSKIGNKQLVVSEYGKSDFQSLIFPIWNPKNSTFGQISDVSKTIIKENIPGFYWTLYDFKEVSSDVAGRWPWQKEPQKHFGLLDLDGKRKETSAIIINNSEYRPEGLFGFIPKFIYSYILFGVIIVLSWLRKNEIIHFLSNTIKTLNNRFLSKVFGKNKLSKMKKKLNIAVVSSYPPSKRTLNEYGFYLINHFRNKPNDYAKVSIISDILPEGTSFNFPDGQVETDSYQVWDFNLWSNPLKILKAVKKSKADIVLYNIQFLSFGDKKIPAALGLLSPLLTKLSGYPSVVLLHNILEQVDLNAAGITQNKLLAKVYNLIGTLLTKFILSADLLAVTIPKYVEILEEKYKAKNVALIPHGSFEIPPLPDFDLPKGPLQVMAFGKFGTYKKVEAMIEAVEIIRKRTSLDMEIVVAGTDSPNTPGYLDGVEKQYGHVAQMRFTGYVAEEDVPRIFSESAVVVFPYTSTTGSSGVLHQAGSYGKAAIMPNLGDLAMLVKEEGYGGEFFDPESVESLADAIQKVLEDEEYRVKLSRQNYFAAASLPMNDLADWYTLHFRKLLK